MASSSSQQDILSFDFSNTDEFWEDSLDDLVCSRLEDVRVRTALAALPEAQRALIELGFYGERSHAELADLLQLPLGTVKTRIRAGLQKLRDTLGAAAGTLADGIAAS